MRHKNESDANVAACIVGLVFGILVGIFLFSFLDDHPQWRKFGDKKVLYHTNMGHKRYWECSPVDIDYVFKVKEGE